MKLLYVLLLSSAMIGAMKKEKDKSDENASGEITYKRRVSSSLTKPIETSDSLEIDVKEINPEEVEHDDIATEALRSVLGDHHKCHAIIKSKVIEEVKKLSKSPRDEDQQQIGKLRQVSVNNRNIITRGVPTKDAATTLTTVVASEIPAMQSIIANAISETNTSQQNKQIIIGVLGILSALATAGITYAGTHSTCH